MRVVTASTIGDVRAGFEAKRHPQIREALRTANFTLASLLEMSAWIANSKNNDDEGRAMLRSCFCATTEPIIDALSGRLKGAVQLDTEGEAEISSVSDLTSGDRLWLEFVKRFSDALLRAGYERNYARALAFSLHEMGDNVRQHAGHNSMDPIPSAAGWHVVGEVATFAVVDLGRGVRASLQTNPMWAGLKSDHAALLAVLRDQATRKSGNSFGDGYREVVQNFVSRNGCLGVRSGTAEVTATGSVVDGSIKTSAHPRFDGTRVVAWCAPNAPVLPPEPPL